ncbi:MAG: LuxR C-terminal-related transcriptional regulator [Paludibacteraceae bacterium]|nr:LuxR C-terminal-related transcriptional regulator [Paludibacteraceae bacterium]
MNNNKDAVNEIKSYANIVNQHPFVSKELDYSILENYKPILYQMAQIGNSSISVYDLYQHNHAFYSLNFVTFLGYAFQQATDNGQQFLDSKIHPEDCLKLRESSNSFMKVLKHFTPDEKLNFKFINEYRIMNIDGIYIWVIEQHQAFMLDNYGNIWLAISIIDISPNQSKKKEVSSQFFNFRTRRSIPFQFESKNDTEESSIVLTKRESQILSMVKKGFLSKEISDKLSISVHTVNTHRQRVLEKLGADNSIEAIIFATKYGLLD